MANESSGAGPSAGELAKAILPKKAKKKAPTKQGQKTSLNIESQVWAYIIQDPDVADTYIAEVMGLTPMNVGRIRKRMPPSLLNIVMEKEANKPVSIAQRVASYIENTLDSLDRINKVTENEEWILRQNASELGTFYGIKSDKVLRLLEAAQRANQRPPELLESATEGGQA